MWSQMSFGAAEENFTRGGHPWASTRAVYWPGMGEVPIAELVLRRLLPLAHEGLREWGVDDDVRERLLGDHRGTLRIRAQRRRAGRSRLSRPSRPTGWTGGRRCAG